MRRWKVQIIVKHSNTEAGYSGKSAKIVIFTTRGNGDYMNLWTIVVEYTNDDGRFKKERTFEALPSNKYYREVTGRDLPHQ